MTSTSPDLSTSDVKVNAADFLAPAVNHTSTESPFLNPVMLARILW